MTGGTTTADAVLSGTNVTAVLDENLRLPSDGLIHWQGRQW